MSSQSSDASQDSSLSKFLSSLVIDIFISLVIFTLFIIARMIFKKFYHRRDDVASYSILPFKAFWKTISYRDKYAWNTHGPDFIIYCRFLRIVFYIFIALLIPFLILIPINIVGENKSREPGDPKKTTGLNILTYSNITTDNASFVAHVIMTWYVTLVCWALFFYGWKRYIHDRRRWFAMKDVKNYTVMVLEMPNDLRSDEKLREWFESYYPGNVIASHVVRDASGLRTKRKKYTKASKSLARAEYQFEKKGTRPRGFVLPSPKRVDSLEYWGNERETWREKSIQRLNDPEHYPVTRTGFVTMDNTFGRRCLVYPRKHPYQFFIEPAPEVNDVNWSAASVSMSSKIVRYIVVEFCFVLLALFWTIPVGFIASVTTLDTISNIPHFGWLDWIVSLNPEIRGFIQGFLPTLVLIIFIAIVVPIIKLMTWIEAPASCSQHSRWVLNKYWLFQMFHVIFTVSIIGSTLSALDNMINHPSSIATLLAQALPKQSTFYIIYYMTSTSWSILILLNPAGLLIFLLKYYILAKTPAEKQQILDNPPEFQYSTAAATQIVFFTIGIIYCVMAPLIIPFVIFFFGLLYIAERYNLLFVNRKAWEGGGQFWPAVFHRMMIGLLIFQGVMMGLLGLSQFIPGIALIPLPLLSLLYWWLVHRYYNNMGDIGVLDDKWKDYLNVETDEVESWKLSYLQPEFLPLKNNPFARADEEDGHDVEIATQSGVNKMKGESSEVYNGKRQRSASISQVSTESTDDSSDESVQGHGAS